jgi:hypothetical protein
VEAGSEEGRLRNLVQAGWAKPLNDPEVRRSGLAAKRAWDKIETDLRSAEDQQRKAEEAEMRRALYAEAERRDPSFRRQEQRQPDPPKIEVQPVLMYPDNPEKRAAYVQTATLNPRPAPKFDKSGPEREELEKQLGG